MQQRRHTGPKHAPKRQEEKHRHEVAVDERLPASEVQSQGQAQVPEQPAPRGKRETRSLAGLAFVGGEFDERIF